MERMTKAQLKSKVEWINRLTNSPLEPYTKDDDGKFHSNPGNYHLSWAYGGVCLHRMCKSGGVSSPLSTGHIPKRDLFERMHAYALGLIEGQK